MADDAEDLEDERAIELSAISAIYPELIVDASDPFSASIDIRVEPIKPLAVIFPPLVSEVLQSGLLTPPVSDETPHVQPAVQSLQTRPTVAIEQGQDVHHLAYLPPLTLNIHLQDGYPTKQPPIFDIQSKSPWIPESKLRELGAAGLSIWEEMGRDQVVFAYIDFLRDAAEQGFNLLQENQICLEVPQSLNTALLDFDLQAKRTKFEQETFECGVCLEPKKGIVCHRLLLCSHVFCVGCLQEFFNSCITEGDVTNVACMAPNCESVLNLGSTNENHSKKKRRCKQDRTLDPSELLQIPLEQETVQKYVRLKRKQKLESDRTTVYCPRQWCQGPAKTESASQDSDSDSESDIGKTQSYDPNASQDTLPPPHERLAVCEDCSFAFCKVCKVSWHGEFFSCFPRKQYELTAEERATEEYIKSHTTACPTCGAHCQKTMGCNHMTCFKCKWHFCYLCSSWLDKENPYKHFNTPNQPCYMRLWEKENGEDGGPGLADYPQPIQDDVNDADDAVPIDLNLWQAPPPHPRAPLPPPAQQPQDLPHRQNQGRIAPGVAPNPPPPEPIRLGRQARIQLGLERLPARVPDLVPPMQGLQRFLQLARDDEEDGWDSDEMGDGDEDGDGDDGWVIQVRR